VTRNRCPFSVPIRSFLAVAGDARRACGQHTAVLEAPPFPEASHEVTTAVVSSAVLPPAPAACRTAREVVRAALARDGAAGDIDMAELVVSELAANAVRHAHSTFTAEVSLHDGLARIAVTDAAPLPKDWKGFPVIRDHGLGLVAALASDWTVEPLSGGRVVWADVERERA
jgi:anti-sigma regulatory factor (Ser/Thr protein kinase)